LNLSLRFQRGFAITFVTLILLGLILLPGAARSQDYTIPDLYGQLPSIIGANVNVLGFYTNPADNNLVFDYEAFQDDELMPPLTIAYIDGPAAPVSMWFGAYLSVNAIVDTFHVDDPYWPADSVQIVLTNVIYTLLTPSPYPSRPDKIEIKDFNDFERMSSFSSAASCDSCKFAILISGGGHHNHSRYWNNIEMLYKLKTDSLGYCKNNVHTLYAKGNSEDTTVIANSDVDSCTVANVQNAFKEVSNRVAECRHKEKTSKLQIMITNHGRADGYIHMLGSGVMSPGALRGLIQTAIDSCLTDLVVEMVQCYGGRAADSLKSLNDKAKTKMNVSSAAGDDPHRSDTHHPDGGWATYIKVKVDSLKAGASYEDAVRAGLAAYDSLLKAQGLESRRGKSVHWRNYPMKKYCEWHMVEVPPGGQLILEFSGDSTNCGNVTVYKELPDGTKKKVSIWNWNIPGSLGYKLGYNKRAVNADSNSTGRFWIHNDNGAFRLIATSEQKRTETESPHNLHEFAGHSLGGSDGTAAEFSAITVPTLVVENVDQPGFELTQLPREIGLNGVGELITHFTNYGNEYWSNMELYLNVLDVDQPGELWVDAAAESGLVHVEIIEPGEYTIPLGAVMADYIHLNPGGLLPESADFTLDAWGLRVPQEGNVTDVSDGEIAPVKYRVYQSFPNPFNPTCTIRYELPKAGNVSLRVYDVNGRLVSVLADKFRKVGAYSEVWKGKGRNGRSVTSGVYFYQFKVNDYKTSGKMILLR
jgi:hypothetical protein